jgi:hypothetical protein
LFVENVAFPLDETFDNSIMLEFFAGKMMPFRNDQSLFLCAARSGRSQVLQSFTMGVRRLFSRGGQAFPGGRGQVPTFCLKTTKKILFLPKKSKNILFLAGLGPRPPPPMSFTVYIWKIRLTERFYISRIFCFLSFIKSHWIEAITFELSKP